MSRRQEFPSAVAAAIDRLTLATALGWVVTGGLAVVALLRLVAWDALEPFALLNELTAAEPAPAWAASALHIRLFDANVYVHNPSMVGYLREIEATKPDLVTMEEATPSDAARLERSPDLAGLPHHLDVARIDSKAFFLASKYTLSGTHIVLNACQPLIVETTIALPSGPQSVWMVHTAAPVPGSLAQWKSDLAVIDRRLKARGPNGLLIVGDFNATWGSRGFRTILDEGMTDGAAARGNALDMTWTQNWHPLPPLVRIDHVLTGSAPEAT